MPSYKRLPGILLLLASQAMAGDLITGENGPFRRLFLDALVVERSAGLTRVFHQPVKFGGNPLLKADTDWERGGSGPYLYGTVLQDQAKLRMWYHYVRDGYRNAYAESEDGIHWTKPRLGIEPFEGSAANNLFVTVTRDPGDNPPRKARGLCHNASVMRNPAARDDSETYVMFCYGADRDQVRVAFSADGLRWRFEPGALFDSSDVVNFFYDPYKKRFVSTWKGSTRRGRSVGIATSADGRHWAKPASLPIFAADDHDAPDTQIYGMPVFPYQGLYVGLPWIYHANVHYPSEMRMTRAEAEAMSSCKVDVLLAWSWDLMNWSRTPERKPFMPLGAAGSFDSEMIYTARSPVVVAEKLYFYYGGFSQPHNARRLNSGAIGVAMLRLDGFASMQAAREEGWLTTRREALISPEVRINAVTRGTGRVVAEILDLRGDVIPGFSRAEAIAFQGDSVNHVLRWKGREFPSGRKEELKKIRFYLTDADLYSYWSEHER